MDNFHSFSAIFWGIRSSVRGGKKLHSEFWTLNLVWEVEDVQLKLLDVGFLSRFKKLAFGLVLYNTIQ